MQQAPGFLSTELSCRVTGPMGRMEKKHWLSYRFKKKNMIAPQDKVGDDLPS